MKTIGKYKIRGLLGRGAMGKIYNVEHSVIGKISALKLLAPNPLLVTLLGLDKLQAMFTAEAVTLAGLRHPHIVEILDYDLEDGQPYYLMQYYANNLGAMIGETFHSEQPSRRIGIDKAVDYTRQTLKGLCCLHHSGIIHRDIKPSNLLVTEQDQVKICDFGLSKLRGEKYAGPANLKVGSAWYAPPEQEQHPDEVDFSADLYSVGVTLYRMLTGTVPDREYVPVNRFNPQLDKPWDRFLRKAMAPQSRDRFPSAADMLGGLQQLETAWQQYKEKTCSLPRQRASQPPEEKVGVQDPRSRAVKVGPREARELFPVDSLWRPIRRAAKTFALHRRGVVCDRSTGRLWQQSGSAFPVTWQQAHAYVDGLNRSRFAGLSQWRLPTVDELLTLLGDDPQGEDFCIEPIFDQIQKWLWSCDRRSFTAAWYVSVEHGFTGWQDFTAPYAVRAVHTH
jgi:serine/threonine-protein kinase